MLKCEVRDDECGTNCNAEFEGKLSTDAVRLTQIVIDLLDLQMVLADEILLSDEMKGDARVITWNWKDGTPMPITFTFTKGGE